MTVTSFDKLRWYGNRLTSMSLREIITMRLFRAVRDRVVPMDDTIPESLNLRPKINIVSGRAGFEDLFPDKKTSIIEEANEIMGNCFSIFNRKVAFGPVINWNRDFVSQKQWPIVPIKNLDYRDCLGGDPKDIWELNRHAFLLPLAKAWWLTQDQKYAYKVVELMDSWIDQCPAYRGINWTSGIEFSIRQLSWIWSLKFIIDSEAITENFLNRVEQTMYLQTKYIEKHLSLYSSANNHLISELCALVVVGNILGIDSWINKGQELLCKYVESQILSDGTSAEQAPCYLAHTMEFYALSLLVLDENIPTIIQDRLYAGALYLSRMMGHDGLFGQFGDNDSGHILPISNNYNQHRSLLNLISILTDKPALLHSDADRDDKLFCLLGEKRYRTCLVSLHQKKQIVLPQAFPVGGYYVFEKIWGDYQIRLIFDSGFLGQPTTAGHGHMDALSFILAINNMPILVDPGTYTYFKDIRWRDYFRSTRAHNTITIDDQDQSIPVGRFLYKKQAKAECLEFIEGQSVTGSHDGYTRLKAPVVHTRNISLDSNRKEITINDNLTCKSKHSLQQYFHFDPGCEVKRYNKNVYECKFSDKIKLHLILDSQPAWNIVSGCEEELLGWYSSKYNKKVPSTCLVGEMQFQSSLNLISRIELIKN